jgi:maleate isomerase
MKRRKFITLGGSAAIGTTDVPLAILPAMPRSQWQPDGVGSLGRIGALTPDFDPVPESEICAMAPHGVSIHASRVTWNGEHLSLRSARAFAEPPHIDNATQQLAALKPQAIIYAFTSFSYALGTDGDDLLRARLEKAGGSVPVVLTCPAAVEALWSFEVHRVALVHPPWFSEEVSTAGMNYFRKQGFEVVLGARMTPARSFMEVQPREVYEWVKTNVPRQAEAVFIGGNGLRATGAIQALEESLGRPVLTANQVALWKALRIVATTSKVVQYGRVFTNIGPTH